MTVKHTKQPLLVKITLILLGIFITTILFAITTEIFSDKGIWIGLILSIALVSFGFYRTEKGDKFRIITWSILISILSFITLFAVGFQIISRSLEGF